MADRTVGQLLRDLLRGWFRAWVGNVLGRSLGPVVLDYGLLRRPLYVIDCSGISWLRGVMFAWPHGYSTIWVCNVIVSGLGHYMASCRLS